MRLGHFLTRRSVAPLGFPPIRFPSFVVDNKKWGTPANIFLWNLLRSTLSNDLETEGWGEPLLKDLESSTRCPFRLQCNWSTGLTNTKSFIYQSSQFDSLHYFAEVAKNKVLRLSHCRFATFCQHSCQVMGNIVNIFSSSHAFSGSISCLIKFTTIICIL